MAVPKTITHGSYQHSNASRHFVGHLFASTRSSRFPQSVHDCEFGLDRGRRFSFHFTQTSNKSSILDGDAKLQSYKVPTTCPTFKITFFFIQTNVLIGKNSQVKGSALPSYPPPSLLLLTPGLRLHNPMLNNLIITQCQHVVSHRSNEKPWFSSLVATSLNFIMVQGGYSAFLSSCKRVFNSRVKRYYLHDRKM